MTTAAERPAGILDDTVKAKTGKSWKAWGAILDRAGAESMTHRDIAKHLLARYPQLGPWWSQTVTVGYEQMRGLRQKHEKTDGFSANCSRTVDASPADAFDAWHTRRARDKWLAPPDGQTALRVRTSTPGRSLRITWVDGRTSVAVTIAPAARGRCRVAVQHDKLPRAADVAEMKAFWSRQLDSLKTHLAAR